MLECSPGIGRMALDAAHSDAGSTGPRRMMPPGDAAAAGLSLDQMATVWDVAAQGLKFESGDYIFKEGDAGDALSAEGEAAIGRCIRTFVPCLSCANH